MRSNPQPLAAVFACLLLTSLPAGAQKKNGSYQLHIHRAASPITIDGSAHEPAWDSAEVATNFWRVLPMDTGHATVRTDVRMAYDDHNVYLSAICFHGNVPGPYMVESLRRDWNFGNNDNFIFFLDTFNDLRPTASPSASTPPEPSGTACSIRRRQGKPQLGQQVELGGQKLPRPLRTGNRYPLQELSATRRGITEWGVNFSRLDLKTTEKVVLDAHRPPVPHRVAGPHRHTHLGRASAHPQP